MEEESSWWALLLLHLLGPALTVKNAHWFHRYNILRQIIFRIPEDIVQRITLYTIQPPTLLSLLSRMPFNPSVLFIHVRESTFSSAMSETIYSEAKLWPPRRIYLQL
jgi:hypothetical protein